MAVTATAAWRVRVAGNNLNGGGYDSAGIASPGTDYSQQDAAQLTLTDVACSNTTTITSAAAGFTSAMVANSIWLTGGGATAGAYFITAFVSSGNVTIDRAPGTIAAGSGKVGGAWANPWTNINTTWIKPGNIIYVRGAGSQYPGSNDYAKAGGSYVNMSSITGDATNGYIRFVGENGRPRLSSDGMMYYQCQLLSFEGIFFTCSGNSFPGLGILATQGPYRVYNCVFDQNGYDMICVAANGGSVVGNDMFSSVAPRGTQAQPAILAGSYGTVIRSNNIHDTNGQGISAALSPSIVRNLIANCRKEGIALTDTTASFTGEISANTIVGNGGNGGIWLSTSVALTNYTIVDNVITDHSAASQGGVFYNGGLGTAAAARAAGTILNNWLYNNTSDVSGFALPSGNTTGTSPAYTSASTENFLPTASAMLATVIPLGGNGLSGKVATVTSAWPGAAQPATGGSAVTYVINKITTLFTGDQNAPSL